MSAERHSKGPWTFDAGKVNDANGRIVCLVIGPMEEHEGIEVRANERLIASAPALAARVARLEQALRHISNGMAYVDTCRKIARTALQEADRSHPQPMNDKIKEST